MSETIAHTPLGAVITQPHSPGAATPPDAPNGASPAGATGFQASGTGSVLSGTIGIGLLTWSYRKFFHDEMPADVAGDLLVLMIGMSHAAQHLFNRLFPPK